MSPEICQRCRLLATVDCVHVQVLIDKLIKYQFSLCLDIRAFIRINWIQIWQNGFHS